MASLDSSLKVDISTTTDTGGIDKTATALKNLGDKSDSSGKQVSTFSGTFKALLLNDVVTKGIEGLQELGDKIVEFGTDSVKEFEAGENALSQMNAALASTHGAAGLFSQDLVDEANALENITPYSHVAIEGVENLLLTFTDIHGAIYQKALPAILDVATAMHEDLQSASVQVGKALNDPATGMSMLHRIGVTFTQGQLDAAKQMEATGNMAGAQSIILQELQKEFGGSAQAAGGTFAGSMEKLKNKMDDVKEQFGEAIVKGITPFADKLAEFVGSDQFKQWVDGAVKGLIGFIGWIVQATQFVIAHWEQIKIAAMVIGIFGGTLLTIIGVIKAVIAVQNLWKDAMIVFNAVADANPIAIVVLAVAALTAVIILIITHWKQFTTAFQDGANIVGDVIKWIGDRASWLKDHWLEALGEIIGFFATLPIMWPIYVAEAIMAVVNWLEHIDWGKVFKAIGDAFGNIWDAAKTAANNAFNWIKSINWGQVLVNIGKGLGNGIIDLINGAIKGAFGGIPILKDHIPQLPHFATGVRNFAGGLAVVGENGPELVNLGRGSSVYTNNETKTIMQNQQSQQQPIIIQQLTVQAPNNATIQTIMASINQDTINSSRGLSVVQGAVS